MTFVYVCPVCDAHYKAYLSQTWELLTIEEPPEYRGHHCTVFYESTSIKPPSLPFK